MTQIEEPGAVLGRAGAECGVELVLVRVPVQEDQMPVYSVDQIIKALQGESASTPCVFNCQMGKGRTTLGLVAACLLKEIAITEDIR